MEKNASMTDVSKNQEKKLTKSEKDSNNIKKKGIKK